MPEIRVYKRPKSDANKNIIRKHVRPKEHNFLKWWRVVRYWAHRKYGLSTEQIEMLLYLYDQPLFSRTDFKNFEGLLPWDKTRLKEFQDKGLITVWRDHVGYKKQAKMYELTVKSKRICSSIYKKLTQEEHIPENAINNPVFKGNGYSDRMYRKIMKKMNEQRDSTRN
ncbi:hypothetical protein PANI_CDS0105 [Maribacter phage Panino]